MAVTTERKLDLGGLSAAEGAAWGGFLETHARLTGAMDAELQAEGGLSLRYYDVLRQLALRGGRLRMAELAERVKLTRPGLTGVVKRMEAEGLVTREPDPTDGRGAFAAITSEGERRLSAAHPVHVRSIQERFLSRLTRADLRELAAIWRKLEDPAQGAAVR